jgi:catecholate siderophore receptor
MKKLLNTGMTAVLLTTLTAALRADDTTAPTTADETIKLEKFDVNDVPMEQQILPTSRPFQSVFGTDDNIVDVPRNVTIISRQQLSDINISSVLDFSKLTSSAYTTTNFGAPSNPSIRGLSADLFVNGMRARITSNGNGLPLDFNSIESVNIVKGPATAVQGTSMYVGGFVDLITKRPFFDGFKGSVSYTIGSYDKNQWSIDVGGPISKTLAYRFSYSGEDSDGYWHDYYLKTNSLYGAVTWRPNDHYELFINASANFYRYTENWGINRVSQNLIDNGLYRTGTNTNGGTAATDADPQNSGNVFGGWNTIAWGDEVAINRHERLLKPGDHSTGREFNFQAIQTDTVSDNLKIVNNTFWSYTARNTLSSYYYSEIVDPSWFAENRTEFIYKLKDHVINSGVDIRYQATKAYDEYGFEPANVWDLTQDHNYINVYNSQYFPIGYAVPGWSGRYASAGTDNGDTNDSNATTLAPFVQATWKLGKYVNVITGGRYDFMHANVREPLDPHHYEDSIDVAIPSLNGSLVVKPTENSSAYFTYNYSQNTSGAVGNGGGITGWNTLDNGATYFLDKENFTQPSELYELGTKYALLNNKVFVNFAVYHQTRTQKTTSSTDISKYRAEGFEAELNYQPNKHFYSTLSYSYIDAKTTAGYQYGLFGNSDIYNSAANSVAMGTWVRSSGLPRNLFNGLASYTFSNGFGVTANVVVTSPINNNLAGTFVIPWQYQLDAGLNYHYKKFDYRVSVTNVTDEKNWSPPNSVYGNASIFALAGTQVQFSIKYNF